MIPPTYRTIYCMLRISCGKCTTDEPFYVQCMAEKFQYDIINFYAQGQYMQRISDLYIIFKFLWCVCECVCVCVCVGAELEGTVDVSMIQLIYGCLQYFRIWH